MFKMGRSVARKILAGGGGSATGQPPPPGADGSTSGGGGNSKRAQTDAPRQAGQAAKSGDELNDFSKLQDDPRLPLNVRQIFKITKSWKAIARTMSKTGTAMFLNLFEQNKDLFYLFDRFQHLKGSELHESMELREHAATVMSTLDQSINLLSNYDNFVAYLHSIGELHHKVPGFKREHFWKIEQPFLKAVKQTLDERCNETIEQIYMIAIKLIIETIADGYGQDRDDETVGAANSGDGGGSAPSASDKTADRGGGANGEKGPAGKQSGPPTNETGGGKRAPDERVDGTSDAAAQQTSESKQNHLHADLCKLAAASEKKAAHKRQVGAPLPPSAATAATRSADTQANGAETRRQLLVGQTEELVRLAEAQGRCLRATLLSLAAADTANRGQLCHSQSSCCCRCCRTTGSLHANSGAAGELAEVDSDSGGGQLAPETRADAKWLSGAPSVADSNDLPLDGGNGVGDGGETLRESALDTGFDFKSAAHCTTSSPAARLVPSERRRICNRPATAAAASLARRRRAATALAQLPTPLTARQAEGREAIAKDNGNVGCLDSHAAAANARLAELAEDAAGSAVGGRVKPPKGLASAAAATGTGERTDQNCQHRQQQQQQQHHHHHQPRRQPEPRALKLIRGPRLGLRLAGEGGAAAAANELRPSAGSCRWRRILRPPKLSRRSRDCGGAAAAAELAKAGRHVEGALPPSGTKPAGPTEERLTGEAEVIKMLVLINKLILALVGPEQAAAAAASLFQLPPPAYCAAAKQPISRSSTAAAALAVN